jgi:hypothetical protein
MKFSEVLKEYYEPSDDRMTTRSIDQVRAPRITLRHLNKLRKKREMEKYEIEIRNKGLKDIYNADDGGGDGMPPL